MMTPIKDALTPLLERAIRETVSDFDSAGLSASFETPREEKFGDLSTNAVFKLAKARKTAPRALADKVAAALERLLPGSAAAGRVERIAVEGAGFINFYYSNAEIASVVTRIRAEGGEFGRPKPTRTKNILLEFVSANPTGPLTVAHGRQAALGDSLARILSFCGHKVTKEYYNNDEGVQINILGESTYARYLGKPLPENGYQGDYLIETAAELKKTLEAKGKTLGKNAEEDLAICRDFAKNSIMAGIVKDMADFDVTFDNYYSQQALGKSGKVEKTLDALKAKSVVYENEGAVWFRSTDFGDDKDRVLVKSDKSYTYLTPDIAYHHDKFSRGFDELINILGPDHHGYIARLKASQAALGHDPTRLHVLIAQLVTLYEGTKQVRMSTRAGEFVTLRQILDEVGRDAGRFFFVMRKFDAHLDFDLSLAKSQTPENPVFYIQYAHARIESIKNTYRENTGAKHRAPADIALQLLTNLHEIRLMRLLGQFQSAVEGAEATLEPFRLVPYLMDVAGAFHRFYGENRVVTDDAGLTEARMALVTATQTVIRTGLGLLGVSAPLKM